MDSRGLDAVIIGGSDPHSSEYPAPRWQQVAFVSGFTGEAGDIVITREHAGLWTDTRYFIQAASQLSGTGIQLHKLRIPGAVPIPKWLATEAFPVEEDIIIGVDGLCQSVSAIEELREAFCGRRVEIVSIPDMLSPLWPDRPAIPETPIITLGEELTGLSRDHKLRELRKFLMSQDCDAMVLSALDEIAWTLNIRAWDVEYNPYSISYLVVTMEKADWYVRKDAFAALDEETESSFYELLSDGVQAQPYDDIYFALGELGGRVFIDTKTLNYHIFNAIGGAEKVIGTSPIGLWKAVKTPTEIELMRETHVEDGLALEEFLYWLETSLENGEPVTEYSAALKLGEFRSRIEGYRGDSFETISAFADNAALPHYCTPAEGSPYLEPRGLYLVDSGGQYLSGTTDVTRTIPLGPCTPLEREDYTLVLKGHIALAMAVFPLGTAGCQIDALARAPLWSSKRNFGHGTGHGVGFFLGVHEGPQDIRQNFNPQPLLPGMITSDEPGIYREGEHGVRHENLILCVDAGENEFGRWAAFETLTLCHFDTSIIVPGILSEDETAWLNDYNERVFRTLSPRLPGPVATWLRGKTLPI